MFVIGFVISSKRSNFKQIFRRSFSNQYSSAVTDICHINFVSERQHTYTGATAESDIYTRSLRNLIVCEAESIAHALLHLVVVGVRNAILANVVAYQAALDVQWQILFQKGRNFPSIGAMTITNCEKMAVTKT